MHERDYIHRDIKPDNIWVGHKKQNLLYLIDFGHAKRYRNSKDHVAMKSGK